MYTDIVKPTIVLDELRVRSNIRRMAHRARQNQVRFRPHFKTHQSAAIGEWFRERGCLRDYCLVGGDGNLLRRAWLE